MYIPTKSIYLKDHGLRTGDLVKYKTNSGTGIIVSEENVGIGFTLSNNQNLYVARISEDLIGISTVKVGIGSEGSFVGIISDSEASRTRYFSMILELGSIIVLRQHMTLRSEISQKMKFTLIL